MNNLLTQKFPFAAVLLLLVFCMSCSEEPETTEKPMPNVVNWNDSTINGDALMCMKFSVGWGGMTVSRNDVFTRTTTDIDGSVTFSENDLIAIAVTKTGGFEIVKPYRVKSDGSLVYAGTDNDPFVWKSTSETATIRAWSYGTDVTLAYMLTAPESRDYTLETDQNTNGYRELLYCKAADKTYSTTPMTLAFYHQLSRLVINVDHDKTGALSVTSASIGSATFPIAARFSVPTGSSNVGSWALKTTYGTITPKTETTQASYQQTYSAVIFPETYTKDTKMFTVTNGDGNYVYRITQSAGQSLTAGNQYNYTVTIKDDITKNPLWWVAQYNLAQNKTSFVAAHSTTSQYVFNFNDAQEANIPYYHVPTFSEHVSIIPTETIESENLFGTNIFSLTNTLTDPYIFSEVACNVGGRIIPASTSVFGKQDTNDCYAVRFVNTSYTTAWHYKRVNSPCNGLLIESYLLNGVTTLAEAKTILAGLSSSATFTSSANSETANQTPESTIVKSRCYVQRFFPACGNTNSGSGIATVNYPNSGACWSCSTDGVYGWYQDHGLTYMYERKADMNIGLSVRLFKDECAGTALALSSVGDIICSHGKAHAATTGALSCGGQKVAIVAYIGSPGTADTSTGASHYRGLAIAMEDASGTAKWYTATDTYCITDSKNYIGTARGTSGDFGKGIDNTNRLATAACTSGHVHSAARKASNYENTVPHPRGTSQWFLPTVYQWNIMMKAMTGKSADFTTSRNDDYLADKFSIKIVEAGGTSLSTEKSYWCGVEADNERAWSYVSGVGDMYAALKNNNYYVRPVLAF